ncbi:hypothetical protein Vadar_026935 [Vaccinium darrowii]|uniref:Uncharacterized protein n=1 Tax=Vaccinium darrowii TaxID=229202 RepID=A0ACB7XKM0_9ERIC|nr:hypothetical protein Vadar_026935 [Vaccinium darrowii]
MKPPKWTLGWRQLSRECWTSVSWMKDINKQLEWQLNAEYWISLRKQLPGYSAWCMFSLGLAALGTADEEVYDDIKIEKAAEMLNYEHETQHEKIIRDHSILFGCMKVDESIVAKEKFGKSEEVLERLSQDSITCLGAWESIWLAISLFGCSSWMFVLRAGQRMMFSCTQLRDNVFVNAVVSIQYRALADKANEACK